MPTEYDSVTITCNNGGIRYSNNGYLEFINSGSSKTIRVAPLADYQGKLTIINFIPNPGYNKYTIVADGSPCDSAYWNYLNLPSNIIISFNTLQEYNHDSTYMENALVKYNNRFYRCLIQNGPNFAPVHPSHAPQNPVATLNDYWMEIWQKGLSYQGDTTGTSVDRHITQYPYFSIDGKYDYYICLKNHTSTDNNRPDKNTGDWKTTTWSSETIFNIGDMVKAYDTNSPLKFKCLKRNGAGTPAGIQIPEEKYDSITSYELINECWMDMWTPGIEYTVKFLIVEYEGSFYTNVLRDIVGDTVAPTNDTCWLKISFWDSGVFYQKKNVVESNNARYICYNSNTGVSLQDTTYWKEFYRWSDLTFYKKGDVVVSGFYKDPALYICKERHTSEAGTNDPGNDQANWQAYWYIWNP